MDNLNTHHPASLYEAFEPAEARRIAERLEIHYTPKHGSWLNMAETELAVLARQCLDRRIPNQELLGQETRAWQDQRNQQEVRAEWRFTTQDARIKLKSLYPSQARSHFPGRSGVTTGSTGSISCCTVHNEHPLRRLLPAPGGPVTPFESDAGEKGWLARPMAFLRDRLLSRRNLCRRPDGGEGPGVFVHPR